MAIKKPVVLCILDGWGYRKGGDDNPIEQAKTPHWDKLLLSSPHALLEASEHYVGLPKGQMGNSEVGHMNIGAGRVILQDLPRINEAISSGKLKALPALKHLTTQLIKTQGTCHLLGLLSPGGVHSHQNHIFTLAKIIAKEGTPVAIHAFLDGRDTPPKSALEYIQPLEELCKQHPNIFIATLGGRYFGMDRDKRWDRIKKAYNVLVSPTQPSLNLTAKEIIKKSYQENVTDEFIIPTALHSYKGMKNGDALLMTNFRSDRARQILSALLDPGFTEFQRPKRIKFCAVIGMVEYSEQHNNWMQFLFSPLEPEEVIGEIISKNNLTQLRLAETEKYAHVTFFLNGGRENVFPGEKRILVPSPQVATYDLHPEMSAFEITKQLTKAILSQDYNFIAVNYANTDMVGHTGNQHAAQLAVEAVDQCLGKIMEAIKSVNGCLLVTADHGNIEVMSSPDAGVPYTAHTLNPVPVILFNGPNNIKGLKNGCLADVSPTILELMRLQQPAVMTGKSLLVSHFQEIKRATHS